LLVGKIKMKCFKSYRLVSLLFWKMEANSLKFSCSASLYLVELAVYVWTV